MSAIRFRPAADLGTLPADVLARERRRLGPLVPGAVLELTGGSSVPGALTGGDVDLHLRVDPPGFADAVAALTRVYEIVHPDIWSATLATFAVPGAEAVGVAVTPVGSVHDRRFRRAWARLRTDPDALATYNAMKTAHAAGEEAAYLRAKALFFDAIDGEA